MIDRDKQEPMRTLKTILMALTMMMGITVMAQDKYDYGTDSAECVKNLSLFNEYAKQGAYSDAYPFWKSCVTICPGSRKGLYTNGVKMFRTLIKDPAYASRKDALIDSLIMVYDIRIENFGQRGLVLGMKGSEMLRLYPDDPCGAKVVLKESVNLRKAKSDASVISNYYTSLYKCYQLGNEELETLFNEYLTLSDYINTNIEALSPKAEGDEKAAKKLEKYVIAKNNLDEYFIGFAECEDIVQIFDDRITESPDDMDIKIKALRIMNRKECTENELFGKVTRDVHAFSPTAESAYGIAKDEASKKNYSSALKYMKETLELCGDCAERSNYLKFGGYLAGVAGDLSFARQCANEMLKRDPNSGHAWIIKGDAVRAAASSCDDGKAGTWGAYWVAYDYYARAKSIDSSQSVQKIAGQKMSSVRGRFPQKSEAFFLGLTDGQSYHSDCLGADTTVRTVD